MIAEKPVIVQGGEELFFAGDAARYTHSMDENLQVETVGGEPYAFVPLGEHIVRAVGVCGGRPTVKYTRIEMSLLLDRIALGDSMEEIAGDYRGRVSREAVAEAVAIANRFFAASLPPLPSPATQLVSAS